MSENFYLERLTQTEQTSLQNTEDLKELKIELDSFEARVSPEVAKIGKVDTTQLIAVVGSIVFAITTTGALFIQPVNVSLDALGADLEEHKQLTDTTQVADRLRGLEIKVERLATLMDCKEEENVNR
jgi:hypothetical protein